MNEKVYKNCTYELYFVIFKSEIEQNKITFELFKIYTIFMV